MNINIFEQTESMFLFVQIKKKVGGGLGRDGIRREKAKKYGKVKERMSKKVWYTCKNKKEMKMSKEKALKK